MPGHSHEGEGLGTASSPGRVGEVALPGARRVRIVHISDTHLRHERYRDSIPDGDILIHSGDFGQLAVSRWIFRESDYLSEVRQINEFFSSMPHKHKVFVCGNHELNFEREKISRTERLLSHGIYLQDSLVTLEGVRIYGSPWNGLRRSFARGFTAPYSDLHRYWDLIPDQVDVLVTHSPPGGVMSHGLGSQSLLEAVQGRIKPKAHLFGHAHGSNGMKIIDDIVFSNAALRVGGDPQVIDYYVDPDKMTTNVTPVNYAREKTKEQESKCSIM